MKDKQTDSKASETRSIYRKTGGPKRTVVEKGKRIADLHSDACSLGNTQHGNSQSYLRFDLA